MARLVGLCAAVVLVSSCFAQAPDFPRALTIQAIGSGVCGSSRPCDVFSAGADVQIVVAVTNITDHSLTYSNLRWGPATEFEVRDEDGNLMPETEELRRLRREFYKDVHWRGHAVPATGSDQQIGDHCWVGPFRDHDTVLQPGKRVSFGATPNRYYDMSRPSVYSLIAKRKNDESAQEWVYSNKITVTVTANKAVR